MCRKRREGAAPEHESPLEKRWAVPRSYRGGAPSSFGAALRRPGGRRPGVAGAPPGAVPRCGAPLRCSEIGPPPVPQRCELGISSRASPLGGAGPAEGRGLQEHHQGRGPPQKIEFRGLQGLRTDLKPLIVPQWYGHFLQLYRYSTPKTLHTRFNSVSSSSWREQLGAHKNEERAGCTAVAAARLWTAGAQAAADRTVRTRG